MVVLSASALPGCARSVEGTPVVSHNKDYDISRLSQLQNEFPPGFSRVRATPVATLGPDADKFSAIGVGDVVAVDPPTCRSLIQPVRAPRDSQFTMVGGIGTGAIMVGAVNSPHPLPKTAVPAGCDHVAVTQKVSGRQFDATVTHLAGPSIEGVVTTESMTSPPREELNPTFSRRFSAIPWPSLSRVFCPGIPTPKTSSGACWSKPWTSSVRPSGSRR